MSNRNPSWNPPGAGVLTVDRLNRAFGGVTACDNVTLEFERGSASAVIGPNGAGKSTLLQLLSGVMRPDSGTISLSGRDITRLDASRRFALGISRSFQTARVFPGMSVWDSVMVGAYNGLLYRHRGLTPVKVVADIVSSGLRTKHWRDRRAEAERITEQTLALFGDRLLPRRQDLTFSLSYANRRRVELARVLASRPGVLLLDEPTAGMNPTETNQLGELLREVKQAQPELTMVFVEHKMDVVRGLARRVVVLDAGAVIADGDPQTALADPKVVAAYLGSEGGH